MPYSIDDYTTICKGSADQHAQVTSNVNESFLDV